MDRHGQFHQRPSHLHLRRLVAVVGLCMVCGCFAPGDVELLESQLRRQEDVIRDCRSQLSHARQELQQAQRENDQLHRELANVGTASGALLPEQIGVLAQVEALAVDTWRTGLLDQDDQEGIDHLLLVLYPHDDDGEVVKVYGELEVEALDLTRSETEQVLGHWRFSTEQARDLWHVGFVSTGFHINVPMSQIPNGTELLLHASLRTIDGRQFEVTHSLPVRRRSGNNSTPMPLQEPSEFFPVDVSHGEERPAPLSATSRSVIVPDPPTDGAFTPQPAPASFATGSEATDNNPAGTTVRFPTINRRPPTTTSDSWTTETIPNWR